MIKYEDGSLGKVMPFQEALAGFLQDEAAVALIRGDKDVLEKEKSVEERLASLEQQLEDKKERIEDGIIIPAKAMKIHEANN